MSCKDENIIRFNEISSLRLTNPHYRDLLDHSFGNRLNLIKCVFGMYHGMWIEGSKNCEVRSYAISR